MDIIKIDLESSPKNLEDFLVQKFLAVFERTDAFIYPTDTNYGLGVNALSDLAVEKIFKIKKRPKRKAVPVIVDSIEMAKAIAYIGKEQEKILKEMWPGAVTAIFKKRPCIPSKLTGGAGTIGVRIPNSKIAKGLVSIVGKPITSTSANISGEKPSNSPGEIQEKLKNAFPTPLLFFDAGKLPESNSSTVIDLTSNKPKILRIGPITKKDLNF